jgi:hypothetical protein
LTADVQVYNHHLMTRLAAGIAIVASVAVVSAGQQPGSKPAPAGTAAISGTVTDGLTKQVIPDAVVELAVGERGGRSQVVLRQFTDAKGRFVFTGLPGVVSAGFPYIVRAMKTGYFNNASGADGLENYTGPAIELADGEWVSTANVTLWPPASVSGTVMDESGEPLIGVFVRLIASVRIGASQHWAMGPLVTTDDRGMYRIGQLAPGRYHVMVPSVQSVVPATFSPTSRTFFETNKLVDADAFMRIAIQGYPIPPAAVDGRRFTYPTTFAGALTPIDAQAIDVRSGDDVTGIDVRLQPVPASSVSGVLEGPPDQRVNVFLRLVPEGLEDFGIGGETATTVSGPDGSFTFVNVPAGRYVVETRASIRQYLTGLPAIFYSPHLPSPPGSTGGATMGGDSMSLQGFGVSDTQLGRTDVWARTSVTLGAGDLAGAAVPLHRLSRISGRLIGETSPAGRASAEPPRFVHLQSATGNPWQGQPRSVSTRNVAPGEFAIEGIVPGAYVLDGSDSAGWMVKSVVVQGRDCTNTPIEITEGESIVDVVVTFTSAIPTLTGQVVAGSGSAVSPTGVIIFPVEREQWTNRGLRPARIRSVLASTTGAFQSRALPQGNYYVAAVPAARMHDWREPDFLSRAAAQATRVFLRWGSLSEVTVKLADIR